MRIISFDIIADRSQRVQIQACQRLKNCCLSRLVLADQTEHLSDIKFCGVLNAPKVRDVYFRQSHVRRFSSFPIRLSVR